MSWLELGNQLMSDASGISSVPVPAPKIVVLYKGKDISADIEPFITQCDYVDFLEGESDSLDISLEDSDARWINDWYPEHGDVINLMIGYENEPMLPCGDFEVDEMESSGTRASGGVVHIKALAAGIKKATRTKNGKAFDNTTLAGIAALIAKKHKLTLQGKIEEIHIERVTQVYETDIAFLHRIAQEYGYSFSQRGNKLCFFKRSELKDAPPTLVLDKADLLSWRFRDKVKGVVDTATVNYHDPKTKSHRKHTSKAVPAKTNRASGDELKLNVRAENAQQAKLKADAALDRHNEDQTAVELTLFGSVKLVSGVNIELTGFGKMNGKYTIFKASHSFSRSAGYPTSIELKRVRADPPLKPPKAKKTTGVKK